jgi:hypothetical protein
MRLPVIHVADALPGSPRICAVALRQPMLQGSLLIFLLSYDDAKEEVLRMLDDDRWHLSIWLAKEHRKTRWLFLACTCTFVIGFVAIHETWPRVMLGSGFITVLYSYLWLYENRRFRSTITHLRTWFRRGL